MSAHTLLARFAENVFWLARYMERAESLSRVLSINKTFHRDRKGEESWQPIVQLFVDEEPFFAKHRTANAENVIEFYVTDTDNPSSIAYALGAGRENARSLRHLISTEMWTQLNVLYTEFSRIRAKDLSLGKLSVVCDRVREGCTAHMGITESTFYRDQAWCFYLLGRAVERADQTSRLLDLRYHQLYGSGEEPDANVDESQWNAILRTLSGYHAFRRHHQRGLDPHTVADFVMFDADFPRSVAFCITEMKVAIDELEREHGLPNAKLARPYTEALSLWLEDAHADAKRHKRLHSFMDALQRQLMDTTTRLGTTFFGHEDEAAA